MICLGLVLCAPVMKANYRLGGATAKTLTQEPMKPEKQDKTVTIDGIIATVTESALTIVDAKKKEHTIAVTADTTVTKAGKAAALADVKANDKAVVEAKKGEGDTWTAVSIVVQ
jgi:hypothetical protein